MGSTTVSTQSKTFTVDASNATIVKGNATTTVSSIVVNDTAIIQGTVNGTSVAATQIRIGGPVMENWSNGNDNGNKSNPPFQGNGQPVVAGKVSAISGNTLTITANNGSIQYAVDATNAKILQRNDTISISGIKTGDTVIVQGVVNGTSITASTVLDQTGPAKANGNAKIFLNKIGAFFKNLFKF
jgi:hypothetical protein